MCCSHKNLELYLLPVCTAPVSTSANALLTGCKQRFDNQSGSCNQGCSQYNSTCLYIQYRPTNPLYCEFLWITLVQERTLKSGCIWVLYMSSSFWLLRVESRDFSQAEKDSTANKDEQTHKMTTIFNQSGPRLSFWVKMIVTLWICAALQAVLSFSAWEKSRDSTRNSQKPEDM